MYRNKARNNRKKTTVFSLFSSRSVGKKYRYRDVMGSVVRSKKERNQSNKMIDIFGL